MDRKEKYKKILQKLKKYKKFEKEKFEEVDKEYFEKLATLARLEILKMTTISGSGHLGGSFSIIDIYLMLWLCLDVNRENLKDAQKDVIIISNGHTSAALYTALGIHGFFNLDDAIYNYRTNGSIFEGHPDIRLNGIEWGSGNLGQGLSVGCGYAYASKKRGTKNKIFCCNGRWRTAERTSSGSH